MDTSSQATLTTYNHDRDTVGLTYVYPVLSRRAGGLSIGVNLNTNNACNWRCIYCQIPGLIKGIAPDVDLVLLEKELSSFLISVKNGDFFRQFKLDVNDLAIKDIALSGNGEPTSASNFAEAVDVIGNTGQQMGVFPSSRFVLITNGSLIRQAKVKRGLKHFNLYGGEIWFKFDAASKLGRRLINNTPQSTERALENLKAASEICRTKLQTCVFDYNGKGLIETERQAYLHNLEIIRATTAVREVMLYTLARPSMQPEASQLKPVPFHVMNQLANEIQALGFSVTVAG